MSTLTARTRPEVNPYLRPLPWRRMAWVTWRQHRVGLAAMAALLGGWAIYLWYAGARLHHAYTALLACHPATSLNCGEAAANFNFQYGDPALHVAVFLQVVPALIGAFVGAPVLARELETGTFRYAWTQGFGRWRWTLAKLVPLAFATAVAAGAFSLLFSWYYQPFISDGHSSTFLPEVFDLRGVAFAAWTLAAFAIGALAGMLIRRVVPAIALTIAVYAGLAVAVSVYLRQHYQTALVSSRPNLPSSAWILSQWWTKSGRLAFAWPPDNLVRRLCPPSSSHKIGPQPIFECLARHGYTHLARYQPANRFWHFQLIEGGWLLGLSMLLIAATVWLVRRRAA